VLALCLLWFGPQCVDYERRQAMHNRIAEQRKVFATEMLRAAVRRWVAQRNPAPEYAATPEGRRTWQVATRCVFLLYTDHLVKKYKVMTYDDVEVSIY
jgi:hypothetical protein